MLGLLSLDDAHGVAAAVLCSSGCSSWAQLQSVSNIGVTLMDVYLYIQVRCKVEGEVLPIYHAVLFDPCIMESPAPSQAHPAPKHDEVLSVLHLASC